MPKKPQATHCHDSWLGHRQSDMAVVFLNGSLPPEAKAAKFKLLIYPVLAIPQHLMNTAEASLVNWLAKQLPSHCYLIGLSLGGMLCRAFAAQYPERVAGLITISSNLKFVANEQYPHAMARDDFDGFLSSWTENSQTCLKRFTGLLAQGDTQQRPLIRQLRSLESTIDPVAGGGPITAAG